MEFHKARFRFVSGSGNRKVDLAKLQKDGKLDVASPSFSAAGLQKLQLHLRLQARRHGLR